MNVKYFPLIYDPPDEKKKELRKIQEDIHFKRVDYFFAIRNDPHHIRLKRKEILHQKFREKWKVYVDGELIEEGQGVG